MLKKNVAIIFGGKSSEHEVSRRSATCIINNISNEKYNIYTIGITKQGQWFLYTGDTKNIFDGSWEFSDNKQPAYISPDPTVGGIITGNNIIKLDAVIPVLHGKNGEDGTIQGLLELACIPYVGCNTLSSASCMDKITTNILFDYNNIDQAKFAWFNSYQFKSNPDECILKVENTINSYPVFVKPSNAGSSVGVGKASNRQELVECIKTALKEDNRILVEEAIVGKEVECAVLGNDELIASIVGEISTKDEFYDYNSKYVNNSTELFIPARINSETMLEIQNVAKKAYHALGCSGLSRIDFFVEESSGRVLLNEINTLPGFTDISMYPMLMDKSGICISELIERLITLALERKECIND